VRKFLHKYSVLFGALSVIITVTCVIYQFSAGSKATSPLPAMNRAYFYDVTSNKLVEEADNLVPPVNQSGHELVKAMVFACKSCADTNDRAIGYLKTFTPERKQAEESARKGMAPGEELPVFEITRLNQIGGELIRAVDSDKFIPADQPAAAQLISQANSRCPGGAIECKPF
jgi:hypothetical protein